MLAVHDLSQAIDRLIQLRVEAELAARDGKGQLKFNAAVEDAKDALTTATEALAREVKKQSMTARVGAFR
jgi:hypothetical protein